jgi:hypothetical protein
MTRGALLFLLLALPVVAQNLPEAPSATLALDAPPIEGIVPNVEAPQHRFLDKGNRIRLLALAGVAAADGVTTQHLMTEYHGQELNPLARPLVNKGPAGQAAASILGYGLGAGTAYVFHRTNHHRLERMALNLAIGIQAECVVNNLVQIGMGKPR